MATKKTKASAKKVVSKKAATPKKTSAKPAKIGHNSTSKTKELLELGRKYYTHAYKPREMILDRGKGSFVWDLDGNDYVDLGAGIAVSALGHHNNELLDALKNQAKKLWHTSNIFFTEPPVRLAEYMAASAWPMSLARLSAPG